MVKKIETIGPEPSYRPPVFKLSPNSKSIVAATARVGSDALSREKEVSDMATFDFKFYDAAPLAIFTTAIHGISIYTGPSTADGSATIQEAGSDTNADVAINGRSSSASGVAAERSWTLRDTVTNKTFEVVEFEVEDFDARGIYLLSDDNLVSGRTYETLDYDTLTDAANGEPAFSFAGYSAPSHENLDEDQVYEDNHQNDTESDGAGLESLDFDALVSDEQEDEPAAPDFGAFGDGPLKIAGADEEETTGDTLDTSGPLLLGPSMAIPSDEDDQAQSKVATLVDGTVINFSEIESIICFTQGTLIDTIEGPRPIEDITPGDLVITVDRGPMPVRWHGSRSVPASGDLAPVRFEQGVIGNSRPLLVSPQHRMLITDHRAQLHFGEIEVLVPAKALIDGQDIVQAPQDEVTYHHLLLDWHAVLTAEGAPAESYHPGAYSLEGLDDASRDELFSVFPVLRSDPGLYGPMARPTITAKAGSVLAA